jgi:hypothetical protein
MAVWQPSTGHKKKDKERERNIVCQLVITQRGLRLQGVRIGCVQENQ